MEAYTRVLQGHIGLATAKFPDGTPGFMIDAFARRHLWDAGLDYQHGTGHGVGAALNVHEGPHVSLALCLMCSAAVWFFAYVGVLFLLTSLPSCALPLSIYRSSLFSEFFQITSPVPKFYVTSDSFSEVHPGDVLPCFCLLFFVSPSVHEQRTPPLLSPE